VRKQFRFVCMMLCQHFFSTLLPKCCFYVPCGPQIHACICLNGQDIILLKIKGTLISLGLKHVFMSSSLNDVLGWICFLEQEPSLRIIIIVLIPVSSLAYKV
jgi:hypothetical protein